MNGLNVAIADHNDQIRAALANQLQADNELHLVGTAKDGFEAYNLIKQKEPDVMVIDLVMPRFDGLSVLDRAKTDASITKVPKFLVLTSINNERIINDAFNLGVMGGSQGGALAMVTASLDSRVKALVAFYPALCDVTGYLHGRAGGWPHMFDSRNMKLNNTPEKISTTQYYDVVNFARRLQVPGYYSWGYNDPTCPPTSLYAAYNVIAAPKQLYVAHDAGHWRYPEQTRLALKWLYERLSVGK